MYATPLRLSLGEEMQNVGNILIVKWKYYERSDVKDARHCDYDELIRMFKWIERIQHRNFAKLSQVVKTATCNEIAMVCSLR